MADQQFNSLYLGLQIAIKSLTVVQNDYIS